MTTMISRSHKGRKRMKDWKTYAPYMVVCPRETVHEAIVRHRRETGHIGRVCIIGFNGMNARARA